MDIGEVLDAAKANGLLGELVMRILRDADAYRELAKYFIASNNGLFLKPIGVVRHGYSDDDIKRLGVVDGIIEVFEEFKDGLKGIDGFSHLIVISLLNEVNEDQRRVLIVKPRRLVKYGISEGELPEVGVFATDSPHRPNPIGLSIVKLISRDGRFLKVSGLDLFNGTPVLDIKPYTPDRFVKDLKVPEWYSTLFSRIGGRAI